MIDETTLCSGTLYDIGLANVRLLKHLMECQMVTRVLNAQASFVIFPKILLLPDIKLKFQVAYNFEYYNLEMPGEVQFLILSEGKSNILPADLVVPFQPNAISSSTNVTPELLESWRWYLAEMKSIPHSIEPDLQKVKQMKTMSKVKHYF